MMKRIEVNCAPCGFKADLLVGSVSKDQTFSDVNEDFAFYQLMLCPVGKEILSLDIHDRSFNGKCPVHGATLEPLAGLPKTCPMCNAPLEVVERDILPGQEGAMQ